MSGLIGLGTGILQGQGGAIISAVGQAFPAVFQQSGIGAAAMAFIRQPRSIGSIIPDVTIEENFEDRLQVTSHPVAIGSPIQDHAYREPRQCTMKIGFSNSNPLGAAIGGLLTGGGGLGVASSLLGAAGKGLLSGDVLGGLSGAASGLISSALEQRASQMYQQLLQLQYTDNSKTGQGNPNNQSPTGTVTPFQLTAGKRTYPQMVITNISVRNDHHTEYAVILEVRMQEVIFVSASQSSQPSSSNQSNPSQTQSPNGNNTAAQPQPPESTFHSLLGSTGIKPSGFFGDFLGGMIGQQ